MSMRQCIYNDNMTQVQYTRWFKRVLKNAAANLAPGGPFYIWNGHRQFGPMYTMLGDLGFKISCVITWAKESFAIGYGDYHQQTEFCLYGWLEENGAHNWYGPNNESTLWQVKRESLRFLNDLKFTLLEGVPEAQRTALRKCISEMEVDRATRRVDLLIHPVPMAALPDSARVMLRLHF